MKVIGTLKASNSFIFCISSSSSSLCRFDVYSFSSQDSAQELQPLFLNTVKPEPYNSYLVGSAIISKSGLITKYSGNFMVLSTVLNQLTQTKHLIDITSGMLAEGEYLFGMYQVEIIRINSTITSTRQLSGVVYTPYTSHDSIRDVVAGVNRKKLKTFNEVIKDHDMSWYFDEHGRCKKDYRLIQSLAELRELMEDAKKYEYMSFDTETTGTKFYWFKGNASKRSKICGMSLSWKKNQGIYIPFMSNVFSSFSVKEVMNIVYPVMRKMKIICHNGMFDFKVLYSYGYYIPIAEGTLLMAFNLDTSVKSGSKGLKTLTRKYLNHETIELDELTGGTVIPELIPDIDKELIKVYACSDSDYTLQLFHYLHPYVKDMPCYTLDVKLIDILAIAEYQGAPINMNLLHTMSDVNKRDMQHVEDLMNQYLRAVGTQALAVKAIKANKPEGYVPTVEEVKALCKYDHFIESIQWLFTKKAVNPKESEKPLQFSAPADVCYILYDLLEYPITSTNKSGSRTSGKDAISRLLEYTSTTRVEFLKEDLITSAKDFGVDSSDVLISKSKFEGYKYPFAYLLQVWRKLQKFDSSFFGPLLAESATGYYNTDNSMTSAETGRVINKIQTLEGSLKELVVPRDSDWYMIVFDKSQIEFRVMLGLAATYWKQLTKSNKLPPEIREVAESKNLDALIERLNDWEKDYHREGGAIFAGCTPDTMTNKQRKKVKAIHFSVPYGANAMSVAKPKLAGHPESEWSNIIAETEGELSAWRNKLYPLYYYLEHVRDVALQPIAKNPPGVIGTYGKVQNAMGRYRLFDLSDMSYKHCASIRRQAGNYPIQSLAREIFFTGVLKLFNRLKAEGVISEDFNKSKALLNIFVHDEVVLQVHKSIHPYRMYKYIMETNLTKLPGHPTYFMGIAVTDTWGKGKTDSYEAPIGYVEECIAKYEANQQYYDHYEDHVESLADEDYTKLCWDGITDWFARRASKELEATIGDTNIVDPRVIHDKLLNYYVKPRLPFYTKPCRKPEYKIDPTLPPDTKDDKYNGYIKLFDYYLLKSGEYKHLNLLFNNKVIPYSEILDTTVDEPKTDTFSNFSALDDVDFANFDMRTEQDEDYAEKEAAYAQEAYLVEDPDLAVDLTNANYTKADTLETTVEKEEVPSLFGEDTDGKIVFFIDGLSKEAFNRMIVFIRKYISPTGKDAVFFTGSRRVSANAKVNVAFTKEELYYAVFPKQAEETSHFGG